MLYYTLQLQNPLDKSLWKSYILRGSYILNTSEFARSFTTKVGYGLLGGLEIKEVLK